MSGWVNGGCHGVAMETPRREKWFMMDTDGWSEPEVKEKCKKCVCARTSVYFSMCSRICIGANMKYRFHHLSSCLFESLANAPPHVMGNPGTSQSLIFNHCMWESSGQTHAHTRDNLPGADDANSLITLAWCSIKVQIGRDRTKKGWRTERKEERKWGLLSQDFYKWNTIYPISIYI